MFFTPRHIKEGKHYRHALKRLIHYKEDILPAADLETLRALLAKLQAALKSRSREQIHAVRDKIESEVGRIAPPPPAAGWRENVEVFLVAIVIAAGVRAYFLQPFKIPTGSMQPTLFGIVGVPTDTPPPNILERAFKMVWLGRHYVNLIAEEDDIVRGLQEKTYANFFTFTDIVFQNRKYRLFAPKDTLLQYFGVQPGRVYRKGEPIARGYIDTGDQVFVDKFSYHFRKPASGDVFVFKTTDIKRIAMPPGIQSQHYIKRLAGLPGQTLRIDSPDLYIDEKLANLPVFKRVMSEENGYGGYANSPAAMYLSTPKEKFTLPPHTYFALGDNSYHSSDSRYWGTVPERNLAGKGFIVYWPFSKRWGFIH